MKKIILASSSPRRKDILEKLNLEFEIIPSAYDESLESLDFAYAKIEELAYNKAKCVAEEISFDALVVGADTVVVLDNQILGKPKDEQDAFSMLRSLSGNIHFVVTSICVINSANFEQNILSTTSNVEFEDLTDEMINEYILNCKPLDKAGSYGIQELPSGFVRKVDGSLENIIGLCSQSLLQALQKFE